MKETNPRKVTYNLKEVVDEELKALTFDKRLAAQVKKNCKRRKRRWSLPLYIRSPKWIICLMGMLIALSGTTVAMVHMEGFRYFLDETSLQYLREDIQTVNEQDVSGNVRMVIEEAIRDENNSLIVFSFINEGEVAWEEGVECARLIQDWTSSGSWGKPILSEDGKKLTYYLEGFSEKEVLENLRFKAKNLIRVKQYEEDIDIDIGEMYSAFGQTMNLEDYNFKRSKEPDAKLNKYLKAKRKAVKGKGIALKQDISLEYVGMIEGISKEDVINNEKGLTIYTRNDTYRTWTEDYGNYIVGYISEVMDTRTGKIYKCNGRAIDYDNILKGGLASSKFEEVEVEQIPYLKATKVTYEVQEVIEEGKWQVDFKVQQAQTLQNDAPHIKLERGEEYITIESAKVSALGGTLTIQGSESFGYTQTGIEPLVETIQFKVYYKDGSTINLVQESGRYYKNKIGNREAKYHYIVESETGENKFLDMTQVSGIEINGHSIALK